jgi:hypothetical protein
MKTYEEAVQALGPEDTYDCIIFKETLNTIEEVLERCEDLIKNYPNVKHVQQNGLNVRGLITTKYFDEYTEKYHLYPYTSK